MTGYYNVVGKISPLLIFTVMNNNVFFCCTYLFSKIRFNGMPIKNKII